MKNAAENKDKTLPRRGGGFSPERDGGVVSLKKPTNSAKNTGINIDN